MAPHQLGELERQKDEVIALAARTGSLGPILQFLESWAVTVEIARFPSLAARLHSAEYTIRPLDKDAPSWRKAMDVAHGLYASARESLGHE
ncbi:hypothetical protein [Streptomyces sp. NBC_01217]|uniref:hypothetical protein n=1 Tax=Streptomyces sp. NBC_01217 TaxID=2903779 RepID=UPI002E129D14|nr:hypothetical protein OG507_23805 [Streptomyces sp. NBC_01217]